ncbi:HAD family hydrolase [Actinotalea sp. K2]|uniref:HAD family hydrolase n=1 Tax=Actinotalea sp. K2 TaxID=2939438 RepID=UPI002017008F|nr:HAD family hydrolase [Actinotalea sp. K2]MCL3863240.1 Cof-type HAD-IIB family hydrolase [Actinotalea sp. K2]
MTAPHHASTVGQDGADGRLLVALDIDGTLMSFSGEIRPAVVEAVQAVREAGHHVVLATGRSLVSTIPVARRLGLGSGPAVSSNGAVSLMLDGGSSGGYTITDLVTFDPEPALRVILAELPDAVFAVEDVGHGFFVNKPFPPDEIEGRHTVVDFEELCATPATRVVIRSPDHTDADFHAMVQRIGLHEVSYSVGWIAWLDLNPLGVSKASALETVRQRLGVAPDRTVAVGDGRNDIEMLQWAGRGVAMGHADETTRAAADEVTGMIEDDGAVTVLRSLLDRS